MFSAAPRLRVKFWMAGSSPAMTDWFECEIVPLSPSAVSAVMTPALQRQRSPGFFR